MNEEDPQPRASQWTVLPNGCYRACGRTIERLPAGAYGCSSDFYGGADLVQRTLKVDDLVDFEGSLPSQILAEIERFWTRGEQFRKYGFLHRRGYLLHGKQGSGKSSLIHQVISRVVAQGNVAFFCASPSSFLACVEQFRRIEPERPIVCVFEDIDALVKHYGSSEVLQWLDGNCQVDKVVNLATTNYPERLDRRIAARPRRFDRMIRIDPPDSRLRNAYFTRKLPDVPATERRRWVKVSEGLTFAALSELIISVCCLEWNLDEAAIRLKELDSHSRSSDEYDDAGGEYGEPENGRHAKPSRDDDIPF